MKWFKHQATARNDERIARLEDRAGLEGYGFYFKMLEIVAEVIDSTDRCEVVYSLSRWGRQTNITSKKWLFLSSCCADVGLMMLRHDAYNVAVKIPNLLKYRDNHTKNLQVTSKQEVEIDKEEEQKEKEKKKVHKAADKSASFVLPDWVDKTQWDLWIISRKKKMVPEQMQAQVEKLAKWRSEGLDHAGALANAALGGYLGLFLPESKKISAAQNQSSNEQIKAAAHRRLFGESQVESV